MLSTQDASHTIWLEHELDYGLNGFGCWHAAMFAADGSRGVGSTP